jgi:hypothetical protein
VLAGVPQGSTLGPLLFILFINDVFQLMFPGVELFPYADDTAIIFSAPDNAILQHKSDYFFCLNMLIGVLLIALLSIQLNLITYCLMILMQLLQLMANLLKVYNMQSILVYILMTN